MGARGRVEGLGRAKSLRPSQKRHYGMGVPAPEPRHDWPALRLVKAGCEAGCGRFDRLMGGCSLGLLPGLQCPGPNKTGEDFQWE